MSWWDQLNNILKSVNDSAVRGFNPPRSGTPFRSSSTNTRGSRPSPGNSPLPPRPRTNWPGESRQRSTLQTPFPPSPRVNTPGSPEYRIGDPVTVNGVTKYWTHMGAQSPGTIQKHNLIPGFGSSNSQNTAIKGPSLTTSANQLKLSSDSPLPFLHQQRPGFAGIADEVVYQGIRGIGSFLNNTSQLIKGFPDPFKNTLRDSTNALPLSANLFTRYALNLGGKGIKPPDWMVTDVNRALSTPDLAFSALEKLKNPKSSFINLSNPIDNSSLPKYEQQYNVQMYSLNKSAEDKLVDKAEIERLRNLYERRRREKTVMMFPYEWSERNALDSGRTSIGNAFIKNRAVVDKYDFLYGGQTIKEEEALRKRGLNPDQYYTAARRFATTTVDNLLGNQEDPRVSSSAGPGMDFNSAITNFGRGITSVLPTSNIYDIRIPIPGK